MFPVKFVMFTLYRYIPYTPFVLIAVIFIVSALLAVDWPEQEKKCEYFDSINITDGEKQPNSSILHNNILYDISEYAEFDYMINASGHKVKTDPYIRGCLCKKDGKDCIRLCDNYSNMTNQLQHTIHDEKNDSVLVRLDEKFHILNEKICEAFEQKSFHMNHVIMFKNCILQNEIECFFFSLPISLDRACIILRE